MRDFSLWFLTSVKKVLKTCFRFVIVGHTVYINDNFIHLKCNLWHKKCLKTEEAVNMFRSNCSWRQMVCSSHMYSIPADSNYQLGKRIQFTSAENAMVNTKTRCAFRNVASFSQPQSLVLRSSPPTCLSDSWLTVAPLHINSWQLAEGDSVKYQTI